MTKDEAEALAFKRNAHKGKHQSHVRWEAKQDSLGWVCQLVAVCNDPSPLPVQEKFGALARTPDFPLFAVES